MRAASSRSVPILLTALVLLAACKEPTAAPPREPPDANVVLFLSDAMRAASLPMYGYPRDTAPRLTEMAGEGIVFENHFSHYPGTPISVSQMMTGRLMTPLLVGYKYLAVPLHAYPDRLLILARAFKERGYRTGIVSSHYWFAGSKRLLDEFEWHAIVDDPQSGKSYAEYDKLFPAISEFLADSVRDRRPFFLYVHSMDTHGPNDFHEGFDQFRSAADWPEDYNRYDSEIQFTDHWVGKVLDEMRRRDLLDQTIVALTADHGEDFGEMGPERWNRNHGLHVRRSQTHIPLLMRLPGGAHRGLRYAGVTRQIDLAPTLLRLAVPGTDLSGYDIDGVDLSGEIDAGSDGRQSDRTAVSFSPRYWGIFQPGYEVHYDTWEQSYSPLLKVVRDGRNYPRLEPADDPTRREALVTALGAERTRQEQRLAALPMLKPQDVPARVQLSIMMPVTAASAARPTFDDKPDDDRWYMPGPYVRAAPGEKPAPLELSTEWIPGAYHIVAVLDRSGISGYEQEFDISFPTAAGADPVHVRGADGGNEGRIDLGVHPLGNPLTVRIANPVGGVSIAGLELERQGDGPDAAAIDPAMKERLRQLGYE